MTRQVLNRGTIANDGTGDTLRGAALKIEQNIIEIYNKLGDGDALTPLIDFDSAVELYLKIPQVDHSRLELVLLLRLLVT